MAVALGRVACRCARLRRAGADGRRRDGAQRPAGIHRRARHAERRLSVLAPLYGQDGNGLAERLRERGYTVASTDMSLNAVAEASGKSPREILVDLPAGD
jgi:hypothetical protein